MSPEASTSTRAPIWLPSVMLFTMNSVPTRAPVESNTWP